MRSILNQFTRPAILKIFVLNAHKRLTLKFQYFFQVNQASVFGSGTKACCIILAG